MRRPQARRREVIGYVRVSTAEQAAEGVSLEAQRHRIEAYCAAHGLTLAHVETDAGISARKTTNRPALQRALRALERGNAAGLVAVKLDRLSRTTRDVLDLVAKSEKKGWALHSIDERLDTSSPQGRFVVTILGALAQLEREQAAERTKTVMSELRRQGRRISGKPPFGYTGARKGEIFRLRWRDLCFETGTISLYRPKTENFSQIPMHPVLAAELKRIREQRPGDRASDPVFLSRLGRPYRYIHTGWENVVERAGLGDRGVTPHAMRHSFACHFLDGGAAVTDLQAILGHSSLATTQIYAGMVDRRTRASVEALDFNA